MDTCHRTEDKEFVADLNERIERVDKGIDKPISMDDFNQAWDELEQQHAKSHTK